MCLDWVPVLLRVLPAISVGSLGRGLKLADSGNIGRGQVVFGENETARGFGLIFGFFCLLVCLGLDGLNRGLV